MEMTARGRVARHLFIVSRQHPRLYDYLLERFQDDDNVEVILDRRAASDRRPSGSWSGERREPRSPDDDLTVRSHIIITRSTITPG
jgi:hypothetical protein